MCISEAALQFLIAREVANLLGFHKLLEFESIQPGTTSSFLPPRLTSRISCLSLVGSLYLAYQVCYALHHFLRIPSIALRLFSYTGITVLMLLCQRQLIVSWKHNTALALDAAIAKADHDILAGGIEYYSWKREWNAFWVRMLPLCRRAMETLRKVTKGTLNPTEISPLLRYQVQDVLRDPTLLHRGANGEFFNSEKSRVF